MDIKWGFVDLYLAVSRLCAEYDIRGKAAKLRSIYKSFERTRRTADKDALARGTESDKELFHYIEAFEKSGGTKRNIRARHDVYMRRILAALPNLRRRDPDRAFNRNERMAIFLRAGGRCQNRGCSRRNRHIEFGEMEADHIRPYARGGFTCLANAQALCKACNRKKAAKKHVGARRAP